MKMVKPDGTTAEGRPTISEDTLLSDEEMNIGGSSYLPDTSGTESGTPPSGDMFANLATNAPSQENTTPLPCAAASPPENSVPHPGSREANVFPAPSTGSNLPITTPAPPQPTPAPQSSHSSDPVWMDLIEAHPELSYHQAEILRQVGGMTADTMASALKRCRYLLDRMERLGPAVFRKA